MKPMKDRLKYELDINTECWNWTGCVGSSGYGHLSVDRKTVVAHRFSYEVHRVPIPVGLEIDHLCRNRKCINPTHLEPVTREENIRRANVKRKAKQMCKHGHALDGIRSRSIGGRYCKTCVMLNKRRQRALIT